METLHFHCPACSVALQLPASLAGVEGPCPKCRRKIIGPQPGEGESARIAPPPPARSAFDPFPDEEPPGTAPRSEPAPAPPPEVPPPASAPPPPVTDREVVPDPPAPPEESSPAPPRSRPTEQGTEAFTPPREKPGRSPSVAAWLSACLGCALFAFVVGRCSVSNPAPTRTDIAESPPVPDDSATPTDPPVTDPSESIATGQGRPMVPAGAWEALPPPPELEDKPLGPEATLRAFLEAPSTEARQVLSLSPDEASATNSSGPIPTSDVALLQINRDSHIFRITTAEHPKGFPVAVARQGENWRVDLKSFNEFHGDRFKRFTQGESDDSSTFRLLVNRVAEPDPHVHYRRYALNPPMPGREAIGYARRDDVAQARLSNIFDEKAGFDADSFEDLVRGAGLPLVLELSRRTTPDGRTYILIEDVVAVGWRPGT